MSFLNKTWVRILISLFIAGLLSEINHQLTGNTQGLDKFIFPIALFVYVIISIVVYVLNIILATSDTKEDKELDSDFLDHEKP